MTTFIYYAEIIAWYWLAFCLFFGGIGLAIFISVVGFHSETARKLFRGRK